MLSKVHWRSEPIHSLSTYSCAKCGKAFPMPHDVYKHLDAKHPPKRGRKSGARG